MFRPSDQIGSYTLVQKIGRGAFGEVWLAEERTAISTHRVALKLPNEEDVDIEAIRQEANVWEEVKGHPNILPIIKADVFDGQFYIASEYAPDGSLAKWLKFKGGKAPSDEIAVKFIDGILAGLEHLHSKGVIHRDLKPENILLQAETPRIADFGIARLIKSTSNSTVATGTPSYMAPECFYGTRSVQSDLWATGVIFHLLLTGKLPFPQPDQISVMNAILNGEPDIQITMPAAYQRVINTVLEKEASNRYDSAIAMREDLQRENLYGGTEKQRFSAFSIPTGIDQDDERETVIVTRPSGNQKTTPTSKRVDPWKIAVITVILVIVGIGGVWALFLSPPNTSESRMPPTNVTGNVNEVSGQPVMQVSSPNANIESQSGVSPRTNSNSGVQTQGTVPGGEGYNAWANGGVPPAGAPLAGSPLQGSPMTGPLPPQYLPPGGQTVTIDPNGGSQFLPNEGGVILVPVPKTEAPTPTPKPPAANTAVKPTPAPNTAPATNAAVPNTKTGKPVQPAVKPKKPAI